MTNTTEFHHFLRTRRSIRRFKPDPVPDSIIKDILTTATFAPSAHNRQPWRFCVVTEPSVKAKLAGKMAAEFARDLERDEVSPEKISERVRRSKERISSTPVLIMLCMDMSEMDIYPDEKRRNAEHVMAVQSAANAGMQLLLGAHAEGLGGVWVCSPLFAQETVREVLEMPNSWEPQGMFFLGYPSDQPEARERKSVDEITIYC